MIDDQFNIRIADFGFATPIKGDGSGLLSKYCGSEAYIAPEIFSENPSYQGHVVDLFALGILLFNLFDGGSPFKIAKLSDPMFEKIAKNRYDSFWEYFGRWRDYPEDFKDLINNMLQLDPR
jgi:serine/threonine protein kinase